MSDSQQTPSYLVGEPDQTDSTVDSGRCARLVLDTYAAAITGVRNERDAFDAAVRIYRSNHPNLDAPEARRAVAGIICRKA